MSIKPQYIVALVVVLAFAVLIKVLNPHKKYSTRQFWETATVESVSEVPDEALKPGNRNGSVLMWAAIGATDTAIIQALVERGADVNESDPVFSGTPLTGAAGYSKRPEIIAELARLGADVNKRVNNGETALMIAAQLNGNPGIVDALAAAGAQLGATNDQGRTALDLARENHNTTAEQALAALGR